MSTNNCACNGARLCLASLVVFMKLTLLFGLMYLIALPALNIQMVSRSSREGLVDILPRPSIQLKSYALNMSTLLISAFGVLVTFLNHSAGLKAYSSLALVNALLTILLIPLTQMSTYNDLYFEALRANMSLFEWDTDKIGALKPERQQATLAWNSLQSFGCCGLDKPEDWDKYRPSEVPPYLYPKYCCTKQTFEPHPPRSFIELQAFTFDRKEKVEFWSEDKYCYLREGSMRQIGCAHQIEWFEQALFRLAFLFALLQVALAALAGLYGAAFKQNRRLRSQYQHQAVVNILNPANAADCHMMSAPKVFVMPAPPPSITSLAAAATTAGHFNGA